MTMKEVHPPRWAEAMLRSLLKPSDRESISGDLLEEYRAARRPALGAPRANAWYLKHVLSVLWYVIRPWSLAAMVSSVLLCLTVFRPGHHASDFHPGPTFLIFMIPGLSFGSVMPVPGVSLFDALIYFWAGYHGFQRTCLVRTGMLAAGSTSVVGFTMLLAAAAMITPGLVRAPFADPVIFAILSVYLMVPLVYAVLLGALAGVVGGWVAPNAHRGGAVMEFPS